MIYWFIQSCSPVQRGTLLWFEFAALFAWNSLQRRRPPGSGVGSLTIRRSSSSPPAPSKAPRSRRRKTHKNEQLGGQNAGRRSRRRNILISSVPPSASPRRRHRRRPQPQPWMVSDDFECRVTNHTSPTLLPSLPPPMVLRKQWKLRANARASAAKKEKPSGELPWFDRDGKLRATSSLSAIHGNFNYSCSRLQDFSQIERESVLVVFFPSSACDHIIPRLDLSR